jgi:glutaredoxin 3
MIRIYSIPECPYCSDLKEKLTDQNIEFEDVNVFLEENVEEHKEVAEFTKSEEVPIVRVNKHFLVPNVSFHSIDECVETIKKLSSEE